LVFATDLRGGSLGMDPTVLLRKALGQLQKQRSELDRKIRTVEAALGTETRANATKSTGRRRSRAAREAASRRMKEYWAKRKQAATAGGRGARRGAKKGAGAASSKAK
jgi:hypothetical protein